jgi:exodeoxyribonuclease VII small subunit
MPLCLPAKRIMKKENLAMPDNFEAAYAELQKLVAQMESGKLSLEESLQAYQRGDALLQYCQTALAKVEQQVQILTERGQLQPFDANQ